MSEEYYHKVKCTRGGGEFGLNNRYKPNYIKDLDKNFNAFMDREYADDLIGDLDSVENED